jgi:hypothetical protein
MKFTPNNNIIIGVVNMLNPVNFVKWAFSSSTGRGALPEMVAKGFAKATIIGTGGTLCSLALNKMDLLPAAVTTVATYGFGGMALAGVGVPVAVAGVLLAGVAVKKGIPATLETVGNAVKAPVNFGKWLVTPAESSNIPGAGFMNHAIKTIARVVTASAGAAATCFTLGKMGILTESAAAAGTWVSCAVVATAIFIPLVVAAIQKNVTAN